MVTTIRRARRVSSRGASRGDRRREQILKRAEHFFAANGYADADLQVLADQLGVGKGTLYRHFPTKRQLFLAAVDRGVRRMYEAVEEGIQAVRDPLERIASGARAYLAFFDANPDLVELLMQERAVFKDRKNPTYIQHREMNVDRWRVMFADLMAAGRVRPMRAEHITNVLSDLMYGTVFSNYYARRQRSFDEQARENLDIVFRGILTPRECACRDGNSPRRKRKR